MGFLERFFSPDNVHSVILAGCLVYLLKTERRIARIEGVVEAFFALTMKKESEEGDDDGD